MKMGKFITIEGSEGAGKSTAIHLLRDFLQSLSHEAIFTREPGGTEIAEEIRKVLLFPVSHEKMQVETELLLMFAGRVQHLKHCIIPALHAGKTVVSDRFVDATYAYQGGGRGVDLNTIQTLDQLFVGSHYPDLTLLLDVPADVGLQRTESRGTKDRIEQEKIDFFVRVREAYLERAAKDSKRIKVIDASQPIANVTNQLREVLTTFFCGSLI